MGLNVSMDFTLKFENKENLKSAAKNILTNSGASSQATQRIIEQTLFGVDKQIKNIYTQPQNSVLNTSVQITLNNSLKETIKYLKTHGKKEEKKEPVFGEIWNVFSANNEASEKNPYKDIYSLEIDNNVKNIFTAA